MTRSQRYATWIDRHALLVLLVSLAIAVLGGIVASRLRLQSDLTSLLPPTQPSVRDVKAIQKVARPFGTVHVVVESPDPAKTARAAEALGARLATLDKSLVAQFVRDDGPRDRYAWANRFLFADHDDLVAARDAIVRRIESAKLKANPLFLDLDDAPDAKPADDQLAQLEQKLAELEQKAMHPKPKGSADGTLRLLVLQTTFSASDAGKGRALLRLVEAAVAQTRAEVPGVTFGLTGNVIVGMHEHDSVLEGMAMSLGLTLLLCGVALVLYYRSGRIVVAMLLALGVGVAATFALAWVLVGHLNVMTAFLFAIVVGNGINAALIFVARYLEERRAVGAHLPALSNALGGAMPGTLGAAATAAIAYISLLVTDFRGFREFGAIAGTGMVLTWITAFTTLPALLALIARLKPVNPKSEPAIAELLARTLGRVRPRVALIVAAVITLVTLVITIVFIAQGPFTNDWRDLQSSTPAIAESRQLDEKVRTAMGSSGELSGQAYQLVMLVDHPDKAGPLVAQIRAASAALPAEQRWVKDVFSFADLMPSRQPEKLAVLAEIRALIDGKDLRAGLSDDEYARIQKVRPPDDLRVVKPEDVPLELAWPFIERDGTRGRLLILRGAARLNSFDVGDRLEFAARARAMPLPPGTLLASESLVIADVVAVMEADAPKMIAFALVGSIIAVFCFVGRRRHGLVTIAASLAGVVAMIAVCAVVGLKVHFLDLIALPISIGIGIDYAVNVAARDREEGDRGIPHVLRTTGGAVLLCSYTTSVGYGTLLLSANGGIRAFGLAALIGEVTCITVALIAVPSALFLLRQRRAG